MHSEAGHSNNPYTLIVKFDRALARRGWGGGRVFFADALLHSKDRPKPSNEL